MSATRPTAVSGMFYPGEAAALAAEVASYLADAAAPASGAHPPKAIIAPHAGYIYSGPVAASIYSRLTRLKGIVLRVVLAGPAHRVYVRGAAVPSCASFASPLGAVEVDREAIDALRQLPFVEVSDAAHAREHSLEVHLPFLQSVLGTFRLVPVVMGDATPAEAARLFDTLWGGEETLIVVSSDLSHYQRYAEARATDRATVDSILALSPELDHDQACGATPINGLLSAARRHRLRPELLDLRNSGDTAGDKSRVVGYASFAFGAPE
jgi:AmmeMemoRadiSam system protein B